MPVGFDKLASLPLIRALGSIQGTTKESTAKIGVWAGSRTPTPPTVILFTGTNTRASQGMPSMQQGFIGKKWLLSFGRSILAKVGRTQVMSVAQDYQTWRDLFIRYRLRLGMWLALITYLTFTGLELLNFVFNRHQFKPDWLTVQITVEICLILCLALLNSPLGKRYPGLLFLIFSWSVTLNPQIHGTLNGVLEPSLLDWPLMFFAQATLIPLRWGLHFASQLGVLIYCLIALFLGGVKFQMPTPWLTPPVLSLYLFWICFICILSVYLYERLQQTEFKARQDLQTAYIQLKSEQERSERLLLNVLPESIAQRLKQEPQTIAENFTDVSVLFADIVGFTEISGRFSPRDLVHLLNQIFSAFDHLAEAHGLEKIKTIGDAYMVVAGLPIARRDHAEAIADMALDMQKVLAELNTKTGQNFRIRIGIATGPVVAGVIGIKKFIYDLWGDTVNMASRMESHGIPGSVQVTAATYQALKDYYLFQDRGVIYVKGKGEMQTYLLVGKR